MDAITERLSSYGAAEEREGLFSNRITAAAEHQASKPSRVTVCHSPHHVCLSLTLPPSSILLLQICCMHIHPLLLSGLFKFFFSFISTLCLSARALLTLGSFSPLTFTPLFITSLSPRLNFIPSSSAFFFPLFISFYPLAVTIPLFLCLPCLHSRSPSVFFTFWQTPASLY